MSYAGETISFVANIPVPGPVIGMLLFLAALRLSSRLTQTVEGTSLALLKHLSLLFVPAGVGIMVYAATVEIDIVPIAVTILVGTGLTIAATALTASAIIRFGRHGADPLPGSTAIPAAPISPGSRIDGDRGEPS